MENKNSWKGWLYLLPALVILAVFTFYPLINTFYLSFQNGYKVSTAINGAKFAFGIDNYVQVITKNPNFIEGLTNTLILAVVTVPISTILALLIAIGLNSIKPLKKLLQTIFFLPYVTNSIAIGMVFAVIFSKTLNSDGLFNNFLGLFGIKAVEWVSIGAPKFNKLFVTCLYIIWNALPFKIMILLGALQSVGDQYYAAAKIDGASKFRIFTKVTVPLISPMLMYVVITGFIGAFKEYSNVVGIFGENLDTYGMTTMVSFIYTSLQGQFTGRAAAGAIVLFAIILVFTGVQFLINKKRVHY